MKVVNFAWCAGLDGLSLPFRVGKPADTVTGAALVVACCTSCRDDVMMRRLQRQAADAFSVLETAQANLVSVSREAAVHTSTR